MSNCNNYTTTGTQACACQPEEQTGACGARPPQNACGCTQQTATPKGLISLASAIVYELMAALLAE